MHVARVKYLIVGAGLAGSRAAQAIRLRDPVGDLTLVGQEVNRPYHRPPLSRDYLLKKISRSDLMTVPEKWFHECHVALKTGVRAAHIDTNRRVAMLANGEEQPFEQLLLATGSIARRLEVPGADLPRVFTLRTIEDFDRLLHALERARAEAAGRRDPTLRCVVVGGGPLGIDLAGTVRALGVAVELVTAQSHPMAKFVGDAIGRAVGRLLEREGVALRTMQRVARFEGDGRVQRVVLGDGAALPCDLALLAVGSSPNRDLLRGTPIASEKAILTDDACRTNIEGIYAAGDCAALLDPRFGKHRRIDHWDHARMTGDIAGANMAGDAQRYDLVNKFVVHVGREPLTVWGEPRLVHHRIVRGGQEGSETIEFGVSADGRISLVAALGPAASASLAQLVRDRREVTGLEEQLRDPSAPLPPEARAPSA